MALLAWLGRLTPPLCSYLRSLLLGIRPMTVLPPGNPDEQKEREREREMEPKREAERGRGYEREREIERERERETDGMWPELL